jgi:hypothetical protein
MLTRSTHNNDYKGLRSLRNIEMSLSQTEVVINFNKITDYKEWTNFRHGYNLGKESITDREIIFQNDIDASTLDSLYFGDVNTLEEDIADSREVEFMRAQYVELEGQRCIQMTLRNTMPYQIDIEIDSSSRTVSHNSDYFKRFDLKKLSIERSLPCKHDDQPLTFKASDNQRILEKHKPTYEVFDELFQGQ